MVDTFKEVYDENDSSEEPPTYDEVVFASQFDRTVADFRKHMIYVEEGGGAGNGSRSQNSTTRFTASAPRPPTPTPPTTPLPRSMTTASPPSPTTSSSSSPPPDISHQRRPTTPAIYSIGLHYHLLPPKD